MNIENIKTCKKNKTVRCLINKINEFDRLNDGEIKSLNDDPYLNG